MSTGKDLDRLDREILRLITVDSSLSLADIAGKPRLPFDYLDKGIMAMINRNAAIAEIGTKRHELHGQFAVAAWIGVHTYLMTGIRNRLDAFVSWTWNHFSNIRAPQVLDRSNTARINWDDDSV